VATATFPSPVWEVEPQSALIIPANSSVYQATDAPATLHVISRRVNAKILSAADLKKMKTALIAPSPFTLAILASIVPIIELASL
jgi:hypothetical protein